MNRELLNSVIIGLTVGVVILLMQHTLLKPDHHSALSPPTGQANPTSNPPAEDMSLNNNDSQSNSPLFQGSFNPAIQKAAPAVVNIYTAKSQTITQHPLLDDPLFQQFFGIQPPSDQQRMQSSLGSGVIVDADGYILTNNHVISEADEITIAMQDGREAAAMIVGMDPDTDLAILKIDMKNLPAISLKTEPDPKVGDIVLAIGNPFGVGQTITMGIISATGRSGLQLSTYENYIQTDAAINPGNSGGALINAAGELIGINTAIYSKSGGSQGIGFAIPANIAASVKNQIISRGAVVRGWLGIVPQAITKNLASSFGANYVEGVIIAEVFNGGPAFNAGIRAGDILTHVNGEAVEDLRRTMIKIATYQPNETIQLSLIRQGKTLTKRVIIGTRP